MLTWWSIDRDQRRLSRCGQAKADDLMISLLTRPGENRLHGLDSDVEGTGRAKEALLYKPANTASDRNG